MPAISPPPLTGTTTRSSLRAVGRDLQADRALPGDYRPVIERRDQHVPVPGHEFLGGGDPRRQGGRHGHQFGTVVLDRVGLDLRGGARYHHHGVHAQQSRGVGHRVTVVAARMRDDPAVPGVLARGADRVVGAAQLERAGGLE